MGFMISNRHLNNAHQHTQMPHWLKKIVHKSLALHNVNFFQTQFISILSEGKKMEFQILIVTQPDFTEVCVTLK